MARPSRRPDTAQPDTSQSDAAVPGKVAEAASDTARAARAREDTREIAKPLATMILADVALRTGQTLVRRGVLGGLLGRQVAKAAGKKGDRIIRGRTIGHTLVGTALARVATSSVPGAIVVGGGLLAKTLYDRKRTRAAKAKADAAGAAGAAKVPPAKT